MPNWCSNGIDIVGDPKSIKKITEILEACQQNNTLVFESLIGRGFDGTDEEYENGGWYNHNLNRFSTKWDIRMDGNENTFEADEEGIFINCLTAWSCPSAFCERLSELYPDIQIEMQFEEQGCDFFGQESFSNGKMTHQDIRSYREGAYIWERDLFWMEVHSDLESEVTNDDNFSLDEYIKRLKIPYLTEQDINDMREYVTSIKSEIENK